MKKILSLALTLFLLLLAAPLSALAEGQDNLPYQEWIDKRWIKSVSPDEKGRVRLGWYYIMPGKEREIAYSEVLKNTDRLIIVDGSFYRNDLNYYLKNSRSGAALRDITTLRNSDQINKEYYGVVKYNHPDTMKYEFWRHLVTINLVSTYWPLKRIGLKRTK